MSRISEVRAALTEAVRAAQARGWTIVGGCWASAGEQAKYCCPLSALVGPEAVACAPRPGSYALEAASRLLDLPYKSLDRFITGFDMCARVREDETDGWVLLGQELRKELVP
jgi:hypothetical protein